MEYLQDTYTSILDLPILAKILVIVLPFLLQQYVPDNIKDIFKKIFNLSTDKDLSDKIISIIDDLFELRKNAPSPEEISKIDDQINRCLEIARNEKRQ